MTESFEKPLSKDNYWFTNSWDRICYSRGHESVEKVTQNMKQSLKVCMNEYKTFSRPKFKWKFFYFILPERVWGDWKDWKDESDWNKPEQEINSARRQNLRYINTWEFTIVPFQIWHSYEILKSKLSILENIVGWRYYGTPIFHPRYDSKNWNI